MWTELVPMSIAARRMGSSKSEREEVGPTVGFGMPRRLLPEYQA